MFYLPGSALDGCHGSTGPNSEADTICLELLKLLLGLTANWFGGARHSHI